MMTNKLPHNFIESISYNTHIETPDKIYKNEYTLRINGLDSLILYGLRVIRKHAKHFHSSISVMTAKTDKHYLLGLYYKIINTDNVFSLCCMYTVRVCIKT